MNYRCVRAFIHPLRGRFVAQRVYELDEGFVAGLGEAAKFFAPADGEGQAAQGAAPAPEPEAEDAPPASQASKADLKERARVLGCKLNGRESYQRLQALIAEAAAEAAAAAETEPPEAA
jgi:hypothetical protein